MTRTRLAYVSLMMAWTGLSGGCTAVPTCPTPEAVALPAAQSPISTAPSNTALQQKVKWQEKRISELSMQLDMLKRIDHDRSKDR